MPGFEDEILNTGLFAHSVEAYFFNIEDRFSFRRAGKVANFRVLRVHTFEAVPRVLRRAPP